MTLKINLQFSKVKILNQFWIVFRNLLIPTIWYRTPNRKPIVFSQHIIQSTSETQTSSDFGTRTIVPFPNVGLKNLSKIQTFLFGFWTLSFLPWILGQKAIPFYIYKLYLKWSRLVLRLKIECFCSDFGCFLTQP